MTTIFKILVGTACAIFIWKSFQAWRRQRETARLTKEVMTPYGGMDRL